ncbi:TonB-dependent receptor [Massilia sp. PWRC2]|uniref:TonB-dependent receptor n=1 Tax=Massilia sp. PWRC2 TaxID=2804626 RepID=UPI003CF89A9B
MLKTTVLVRALQLAFSAAALTAFVSPTAFAQSNASGNIVGRVDSPVGASVLLSNTETGLKRTVSVDASGRYQATALPAGHYRVDLLRDGKAVQSNEVDVIIGQGVDASFAGGAIQQVQVNARRSRIDVSSANNGATFSARELAALPIEQSVSSIIQLAPNTTRADPRYAAGASFGGGGASENAYYVNGFPVTNPLTQLGASELPFGAIAQAQVLTGGFGAEFGRSVGGVVNITTKSGTNNWEAGAQLSIEPSSLRAKAKDVYFARTGDPANASTDGTLFARNGLTRESETRGGAYVGGPLVEDKLFMFAAVEQIKHKRNGVSGTSDAIDNDSVGWLDRKDTTTRYMGKLDWNISDSHRLEFTTLGDKPETDRSYSDYDYATGAHSGVVQSGGHYESIANITPTTGAKTNILKYTGNLTDDLTVTALVGKNKTEHIQSLLNYPATVPGISAAPSAQAPGFTYNNPQPFVGQRLGEPYSYDEVKSQRFDIEYKLGAHTLRAGLDNNKLSSAGAGEATAGGYTWVYGHSDTPTEATTLNGTQGVIIANGGGLGPQGYYVYRSIFSDITAAYSDQSAQYLEDRWQVSKNLLVTLGIRDEQYKNRNGDGVAFLKIDKQINPRVAAAWDVNGDSTLKVYGSAGRYSIQIPTHVAIRGASRSTLTREYFTYTGVGADGQPLGLQNLTGVTSSDNEFGQAKLFQTVSAQNIKPSFQDEVTLGFEQALSPSLNVGAKVTYRNLRSTIDDYCDGRPFNAYADAHGIDRSNWGGFTCASINPGETNDFLVDYAGTGKDFTKVTLSAADMGFDKATRVYKAIDLFAEHPLRDGWYGKVNYTWSRSKGNTEGQTLSAVAQTDVAATQTWDHREIMEYASGLLPNDREHQIKAFGFWEFVPQWSVGGNFLAASGQPETCLGNYPTALQTAGFPDYGSAYHYCNGPSGANVPSPQGSAGRLPWDVRLDMDLVYKPNFLKGLAIKIDVFNVFNKQTVQQIDQTYNTDTGSISPTYGTPGPFVGYTQGRSAKFTVEYNHRF